MDRTNDRIAKAKAKFDSKSVEFDDSDPQSVAKDYLGHEIKSGDIVLDAMGDAHLVECVGIFRGHLALIKDSSGDFIEPRLVVKKPYERDGLRDD
jgi:hypothetical protein